MIIKLIRNGFNSGLILTVTLELRVCFHPTNQRKVNPQSRKRLIGKLFLCNQRKVNPQQQKFYFSMGKKPIKTENNQRKVNPRKVNRVIQILHVSLLGVNWFILNNVRPLKQFFSSFSCQLTKQSHSLLNQTK